MVYYLKGSNRYSCFHQYLFKKLECQGGNLDFSFDEKKKFVFYDEVGLFPMIFKMVWTLAACNRNILRNSHMQFGFSPIKGNLSNYHIYVVVSHQYLCHLKFQHLLVSGSSMTLIIFTSIQLPIYLQILFKFYF